MNDYAARRTVTPFCRHSFEMINGGFLFDFPAYGGASAEITLRNITESQRTRVKDLRISPESLITLAVYIPWEKSENPNLP